MVTGDVNDAVSAREFYRALSELKDEILDRLDQATQRSQATVRWAVTTLVAASSAAVAAIGIVASAWPR